ncbi:DoxX family protein [Halarcobacter ebronensis]|uniref:GntR family transcriptional regulator n=1 Tax=Halarcobacter ebronensis TaxID=1462615 RepID=A0A4Q1AY32_9BACT|nr:DoxX family protein [Halarcobacter ebronensis]QKF81012.1 putative membrane protein, DoxX family [Halarcobacter ebronensis]RXK06326.1 GntR family transcriptional regulator [Halarcobacter ebronensis]
MKAIEKFLASFLSEDIGKLLLRFMLGFLMLFHGLFKFQNGIEGIRRLVANSGFPEFVAYGVYVGEIIVPILLILGLYTRISSFIYAITMFFAIYLAHSSSIFELNSKTGGVVVETPLLFLLGAVVLMFIGAGKYSVDKN